MPPDSITAGWLAAEKRNRHYPPSKKGFSMLGCDLYMACHDHDRCRGVHRTSQCARHGAKKTPGRIPRYAFSSRVSTVLRHIGFGLPAEVYNGKLRRHNVNQAVFEPTGIGADSLCCLIHMPASAHSRPSTGNARLLRLYP